MMMLGRVALSLILVALPTTLAGYSFAVHKVPHDDGCQDLRKDVQNVLDDSVAVNALLQKVAADAEAALPVGELSLYGNSALLNSVGADIRNKYLLPALNRQPKNVKLTVAALYRVEDNLQEQLDELVDDIAKLNALQEVLQKALERTGAELSQDYQGISQDLSQASAQRQGVFEDLRAVLKLSKLIKSVVADLLSRVHALDKCVGSICY